jgi:hypothetical protein
MSVLDRFPPDLIDAVKARAEADADLLCHWLKDAGCRPRRVERIPPAALSRAADAAAALRLETWERSGLPTYLHEEVPASAAAFEQVCASPAGIDSDAAGPPAAPLARRVFGVWLRNCSWSAPAELGVDIALDGPESLTARDLEQVADLLWAVHHSERQNGGGDHGSA